MQAQPFRHKQELREPSLSPWPAMARSSRQEEPTVVVELSAMVRTTATPDHGQHAAIILQELKASRISRSKSILVPVAKAAPRQVHSATDDAIGRTSVDYLGPRSSGGSQSVHGSRSSGGRWSVEVQVHGIARLKYWEIVD